MKRLLFALCVLFALAPGVSAATVTTFLVGP